MSAAGTPSTDPWVILAKERARYEEQFRGLSPINGIVTGDQVKGFLLQSQLPPMVLGQIWSLADTDADGKMDISEFSIACKLINLKLRGFDVPKSLPPSLLASLRVHSPPSIPPLPVNHPPPSRPEPPHIQQQLPTMQATMMQPTMGIVQPQPQVGIVPPLANVMMPTTMSAVNVNQPPPIPPLPAMQQQLMMQQQQSVVMAPIVPNLPASMMMGGMTSQPPVMMAPQQQVVAPSSIVTPRASVSSLSGLDSPQMEWSVPHHIKLKYTQIFNTTDRTRSGYLSGAQARNVMVQTKLPQNILAQVWGLSDMDNDGRLGCEEFVLAMHLCELASLGTPPPTTLPLDLIPPSFRRPSLAASGVSVSSNLTTVAGATTLPTTAMMTGTGVISQGRTSSVSSQGSLSGLIGPGIGAMGGGGSVAGDGMGDLTLMQQQQNSFEDKRKENFEKGQAELERRRKALLEQQRKEREEHERKEREEGERRERARVEAERRRVEELERQMRETQERERQMEEERRRQVEQRETARREMERQRQLEWEKQRLQELQQQRQREQESVLRLKAKNQTLTIELTSLNDQVRELSQKICDTRVGVSNVKTTIDGMRSTRDTQMQDMSQLKNKLKEQNAKLLQMSQEKARMDAKNKQNTQQAGGDQQQKLAFENKEITIKNLREKIGDMQVQIDGKMEDIENNNSQLTDLKGQLGSLVSECESLYGVYEGKRGKVIELKGANRAMEYGSSAWKDDWGNTNTNTGGTPSNNTSQDSQWPVDNWSATSATPVTATTATTDTSSTPAGDLPGSIKYRALYEFVQRNNDEISFQPGDIINVPKEQTGDPGWLAGEIRGHTGWFPESYVEPIDGVGVRETGGEITPSGGGGLGMAVSGGMVEEMEPTKLEGIEEVPETIPDTHSAFPAVTTEVATVVTNDYTAVTSSTVDDTEDNYFIASYPYQSVEQGDLNFAAGDVIQVIVSEGDWWTGKIDDRVGIFPSNYVQKTDISAKTTATSQTLTNNNAVLPSSSVVVTAAPITTMATPPTSAASVATYDSNTSQHNQLRDDTDSEICEINEQKQVVGGGGGGVGGRSGSVVSASGEVGGGGVNKTPDFTALTSSIAAGNNNQSAKAAAGVKKPEIASVIAPYEATSKEQLSLARGQLIMIRKKTDSGWWEGELQAKGRRRQVGWFPASYVKVMNSSGRVSGRTTPVSTSRVQQEVIIDKVVALYPYCAANPDELSFLKDDIISVTARDEPAWWRGELNGVSGLFPSNYVSPLQQLKTYDKMRMECINELIQTEKAYIEDMSIVHKIFEIPLRKSRIITEAEVCDIFVNWQEIIQCNKYFLDDLLRRSEKDTDIIGDVILNHLPRMTAYVTFCSRQLESAALLQHLTETSVSFKELVKRCQNNVQTKGMPLSSFLIKPMQRITKYPLLINKIIENTPEDHDDYAYLQNALQVADEFLKSVNENVRLKENQDRLEWMQASIQNELNITFNSCTNKLGQRRLIHYGVLSKVKSGKELVCFLLNDFLILVQASKALNSTQFSFLRNSNLTYKMYKQPILISELKATKASVESVENGTDVNRVLKLQDKKQVISLLAPTVTECNTWLKNIDIAREEYGKVTKSYKSRSKSQSQQRGANNGGGATCGRLLVLVQKGKRFINAGKSYSDNIYCKISVGEQEQDTDVARDNMLNGNSVQHSQQQNGNNAGTAPVVPSLIWNHSMQFHVKNINNDIMTLSVYKLYPFSPDEFLGKAEVKIRDIYKESKTTNGPITKKLILHQVESGEVTVKLDFQRFSNYY